MRVASFLLRKIRRAVPIAAALFLCGNSGLLWLVNGGNPLPPSYVPNDLIAYQGNLRLHPAAADAFARLVAAMEADPAAGHQAISLNSAYRPYDYQAQLFKRKINYYARQGAEDAQARATRTVQPPGASEHQTGLALDVSVSGTLDQSFGDTPAGRWLAANAHRFGFIVRYPASKTHTTRIIYEPWHLRYVGTPHAAIMHARDLALEEYSDFLAAHSPYTFRCDLNETYVIHHLPAPPDALSADATDLSADRFGENARYILTRRKTLFTFPPQAIIVGQ